MAQFDVYRNPKAKTARHTPYFVDIQIHALRQTRLTVVIPLVTNIQVGPDTWKLHPTFEVEGLALSLHPQEMFGVERRLLGPYVTNISHGRADIIAAMDYLLTGT